MPYFGPLQEALPYSVDVVGTARMFIRISQRDSRGRMTFPKAYDWLVGDPPSRTFTIPRGTSLVVIDASTTRSGSSLIQVTQGAARAYAY